MRDTNRPIVNNPVVLRILDMIKIRGIQQKDMVNELQLPANTFTGWKYGNSKTYLNYIDEIASYLGVTKAYLLYGTDNGTYQEISPNEFTIIQQLRELSATARQSIVSLIENLYEEKMQDKTI